VLKLSSVKPSFLCYLIFKHKPQIGNIFGTLAGHLKSVGGLHSARVLDSVGQHCSKIPRGELEAKRQNEDRQ